MSNTFSRRDFMKGAGVSVLAVASAGLFTGCFKTNNNDTSTTVPAKTDTTVSVGDTGNVTIRLLGYREGWFSDADKLVSKIIGSSTDVTWIAPTFSITNNSTQTIAMGNTLEDLLKTLGTMVLTNNYSSIENLKNADFAVACEQGKVYHGDIGYIGTTDGTNDYVTDQLKPGKTGYIKLCCIVPANWTQLTITYTPSFVKNVSKTFVLKESTDVYSS